MSKMSRGTKSLRWVSWAAVSTAPQAKKISLQDQLDTNRRHVEQHGGDIVEELVVPGVSRSIILFEDACSTIEAYARLRELIEQRAFDVLVYLDRSRLGRKASLSMAIVELCNDAGIAIYETESPPTTLNGTQDLNDMLVGAIKSTMAQNEVMKFTHRNRMGMLARVRKGKHPSQPCYGYHYVYDQDGTKHVEPHPEEAEAVRLFFDLYLNSGLSMTDIAAKLTEAGYKPRRAKVWGYTGTTHLRDHAWQYTGRNVYVQTINGQKKTHVFDAEWDALIDDDTARAVEAEKKRRWPGPRAVNSQLRYSMVLYCDRCGSKLTSKGVDPGRYQSRAYTCQKRCRGSFVMEARINEAVLEAIRHLEDTTNLSDLVNDDGDEFAFERDRVDANQKRLEAIAKQRNRLTDAFSRDVINFDEYEQLMTKLSTEADTLETETAELQAKLSAEPDPNRRLQRLEEIKRSGRAMVETTDFTAANRWMRAHFRIFIWKNRVSGVQYL